MSTKFPEYKQLDLSQINKDILKFWEEDKTFKKSLEQRKDSKPFVFYEGPPSANGLPGIHHVIARTIKDIFCRFKTQSGYLVERKAGWDTHGLPVELSVEKKLGITKEDIGSKISVEEYNNTCRTEVMRYTDSWEEITAKMGYWIDMDNPYITYDNKYIETVWYLLKKLFDNGLLYKGYSIQPYSPAAGTGLSTHELNQPGCYRDIKDQTVVAQFKIVRNEQSEFLFEDINTEVYLLAWTTTPWTLPSNTALALGENINYVKVRTFNLYTGKPITVILAKDRFDAYFSSKNKELKLEDFKEGDKKIPYEIRDQYQGKELDNIRYEQLLPYQQPDDGDAFRTIIGDFVTTEDGTGIVHIAPSFGADDRRVAQKYGIGSLTLVDKQGRFIDSAGDLAGKYVKNEYDPELSQEDDTTDFYIAMKLKMENKAFKIEKYVHSYPHCWRTDKPVLYYPLDSWFIKTTALKERMQELNDTINWKPERIGTGRFGNWLENLVDWNLSRSRYWGTPLPVWVTDDGEEQKCIGSVAELKKEIDKAIEAGAMEHNPFKDFQENNTSKENYEKFDLHRPFVDNIVLVSEKGKKMYRESDLIDVWFDSGAMPYAQLHYPFENKDNFEAQYPADFIAEGVDQTRGWFFTLHAIAVMLFDSVAFKNLVVNGLVLDKNGVKMSKRLGNFIDPNEIIEKYGSDPMRWYIISNSQPWDSLSFDPAGVDEVKRKFFGTFYNTYSFFALYANIDNFTYSEVEVPLSERPEIDRWIISLLNTLVKNVGDFYESYEPTRAVRAIQDFVIENLSNWYVRLNRKRFWGGEKDTSKTAAYQTLYTCLETVAKLAAPVAPFFTERIFRDLNKISKRHNLSSVHLTDFPAYIAAHVDKDLEERMDIAQRISSMVLSLRRKAGEKVRQPLNKMMIPVLQSKMKEQIEAVKDIILTEVNVKDIEYIDDTSDVLVKKIKPNFKILGKKYGKLMKKLAPAIQKMSKEQINTIEQAGELVIDLDGEKINILLEEVEIVSQDIPGWLVSNEGNLTVALDITITENLKQEGIAREFVNRIQNLRKDSGLEVTDKINLQIQSHEAINTAVKKHKDYIASQTLAEKIELSDNLSEDEPNTRMEEIDNEVKTLIKLSKK